MEKKLKSLYDYYYNNIIKEKKTYKFFNFFN